MKKIELFERAIEEQAGSLKDWGINPTLFWAYRNSITAGNDRIDFDVPPWPLHQLLLPDLPEFQS